MGNEQSGSHLPGQAIPETGLRLSTLCRYQAESGSEEGLGSFKWFYTSTDVSGLVLKGAHRWGYVLSHAGGQRLFKDMRQRFFVLLGHYLCYFECHGPETRMRGSIDLDKTHCQLELLPRPPDRGTIISVSGVATAPDDTNGEEHHRLEVIRKSDGWSMVLCFTSASQLQSWMKSIFDVQQRKATFSPLRHGSSGSGSPGPSLIAVSGATKEQDYISIDNIFSSSSGGNTGLNSNEARRRNYRNFAADEGEDAYDRGCVRIGTSSSAHIGSIGSHTSRRASDTISRPDRGNRGNNTGSDLGGVNQHYRRGGVGGRRRRGGRRSRGTLYSPPEGLSSRGSVPLSWADSKQSGEDRSSQMAARVGKASERLAGLPRGGRAPCGDGMNSSLDEYGAFTTAHASIYEGWTQGLQAHGWGRMLCANGDCVEGWWEHDVLEGTGEHRNVQEGWTYRGGFVAGERHGPGRLETVEGDVWECEWRHGVVASGVSGTHYARPPNGEVYQGGCAPSSENPEVPCRAGHGKLKWMDGEQVETHFRAGKAVDGAKGVVRFRNGAIFFGQLQDARPHGYGELYLSSVKPSGRNNKAGGRSPSSSSSSVLTELDETARDILWYKGHFRSGTPHGTGLVKYKEPPPTPPPPPPAPAPAPPTTSRNPRSRRALVRAASLPGGPLGAPPSSSAALFLQASSARVSAAAANHAGSGGSGALSGGLRSSPPEEQGDGETVAAEPPSAPTRAESKEEEIVVSGGVLDQGAGGDVGGIGLAGDIVVVTGEDEEEDEDDDDDDDVIDELDDGDLDHDEDDDAGEDSSDSEVDDEEEEEEDIVEDSRRRRRHGDRGDIDDGEEKATAGAQRARQRPPVYHGSSGTGSGGRGVDMEYEAEFVDGVMKRHDPSHLRLAALRFGRAEIRRLDTLLRREEEAMARMHSRNLCLLCNAEEMNALLVGCRHRVLCMGCASRTDACPVCRARIGKVVKTYST